MKILIAVASYPPEKGHQVTYVRELCKKMSEQHKLKVVTYALVKHKDIWAPSPNIEVWPVDKRQPIYIRLIKFFFTLLRASKGVDLIYTQNTLACGLAVAFVNMITSTPFVVRFVGDESRKTRLMMFLQSLVLQKAAKVIVPYQYLSPKIALVYKINPRNIVVNYNVPENKEVLPFKIIPKKHQLTTMTTLHGGGGVNYSIKAVSMLKDKFPDIKLVVVGNGPEMENLKKLSNDLNLSQNVYFKKKVSVAEMWKIREESEICIHNPIYERLPDCILPNFITQTPAIVTNIPGLNEIIHDQQTGILLRYSDDKSLGDAIEKLFADQNLRQKIIENSQLALKSKFSWENHTSVLNDIFESVTKQSKK